MLRANRCDCIDLFCRRARADALYTRSKASKRRSSNRGEPTASIVPLREPLRILRTRHARGRYLACLPTTTRGCPHQCYSALPSSAAHAARRMLSRFLERYSLSYRPRGPSAMYPRSSQLRRSLAQARGGGRKAHDGQWSCSPGGMYEPVRCPVSCRESLHV